MAVEVQLVRARTNHDRVGADFSDFFAATYEQTLGIVLLATGQRSVAEDATQEAFARCLRDWNAVRAKHNPDRWVARIAVNLAIDHLRKVSRETGLDASHQAPRPDQVEELWVKWNLDQLTPMQRAAVVRRYIEGRSVAEVASSMGRSPQTIKSHLRLARSRLRQTLERERGL